MGHALRALGLNLKHGAEDYPAAAKILASVLLYFARRPPRA
jgi:hypothetical protein